MKFSLFECGLFTDTKRCQRFFLHGLLFICRLGDAIIMVPWTLYERFGDKKVLEDNYEAMLKWFTYAQKSAAGDKKGNARYIWDTKFHYGDWMFPSFMKTESNPMRTAEVTKDLVVTAFLAHSAELLADISEVLGKSGADCRDYAKKSSQPSPNIL